MMKEGRKEGSDDSAFPPLSTDTQREGRLADRAKKQASVVTLRSLSLTQHK